MCGHAILILCTLVICRGSDFKWLYHFNVIVQVEYMFWHDLKNYKSCVSWPHKTTKSTNYRRNPARAHC